MHKKLLAALMVAAALSITACGQTSESTEQTATESTETSDTSTDGSDQKDIFASGEHDASEKDNNYESALDAANKGHSA